MVEKISKLINRSLRRSSIHSTSPLSPLSSRSRHIQKRFFFYAILAIFLLLGFFFWQQKLGAVRAESARQTAQSEETTGAQFAQHLKDSPKNDIELVVLGRKFLDKNNLLGAKASFLAATEKNPDYRDAFFYLGYTYLRLAQESQEHRNTGTQEQFNDALTVFLKARDRDPLYAPTYEFLAYIYNKLGDADNAELWYNKFEELKQ